MRVLVAGAGGVAGRSLVPMLREHVEVVGLDRPEIASVPCDGWIASDIRDWRTLRSGLESNGPFHALLDVITAPQADVPREDRGLTEFEVSVAGTWCLLNECLLAGVRRLVFVSTLNVYGDLSVGEHVEPDDLFKNQTVDVAAPYGLAKRMAEQLFEYFSATSGANGVALRMDSLHVPGVMERRGLHIEDLASAVMLGLTVPLTGFEVCNLTADPNRNRAPHNKVRRLLGWEPHYVFELRPELEDWTQPPVPPLAPLTQHRPTD